MSTWRRVGLAAGLAAVAVIATLRPATADVLYEERVERFEIGVREESPAAIWAALNRYGPLVDGRGAVGAAKANVRWYDFRTRKSAQGCLLESAKVQVSVTMILPEWERTWRAAPDMQQYWACVERTVTTHEHRHAEIWRETGERIDRGLRALSVWMACDELQLRISETTSRLYQEGARRQRQFDQEDRKRPRYQMCDAQHTREAVSADRARPRGIGATAPPAAAGLDDGGLMTALGNLMIAALVLLAAAAAYAGTVGLVIGAAAKEEDNAAAAIRRLRQPDGS